MHRPRFRPETGLARPAAKRGSYAFPLLPARSRIPGAWPDGTDRDRFIRELHTLESKAKRAEAGIWKDSMK
jgi:hypothetical protein